MTREMPPLLLLFFLLLPAATVTSESTAAQSENSIGREFIVVFPENIAYYHPVLPQNKVWITVLRSETEVTINKTSEELSKGTHIYNINLELGKVDYSNDGIGLSDWSVQISSNKDIVVQAFSARNKSMQTALVIPADKLGKKYFIPPIYKIPNIPRVNVNITNIERSLFRLIIVNTNQNNKVTVRGVATKQVILLPNHVAQIRVPDEESVQVVEADKPVAVLFGHPCAIRPPCSCGLQYATLQPARDEKVKFLIPPALATDPENETFVLLSDQTNRSAEAFTPASAVVETSGTAVLYRPDFLLTLIPEADFASCYVVTKISNEDNFILIVVHKDDKDGIYIGQSPLKDSNPEWQELNGADYVSRFHNLSSESTVIWHKSSRMGVYYVGKMHGMWFGHPAPIISHTPDYRGCILTPEVLDISGAAGSWQKAITTCSGQNRELIHLSRNTHQKQVCKRLSQLYSGKLTKVWIAMRRSSETGDWYWLNNSSSQYTNWDDREPGSVDDGQCAVMSLNKNKDCSWSDEECCKAVRPLCYRDPKLLELQHSFTIDP